MNASPELLASIMNIPVMSSKIIIKIPLGTEANCLLIRSPGIYFVSELLYKEV